MFVNFFPFLLTVCIYGRSLFKVSLCSSEDGEILERFYDDKSRSQGEEGRATLLFIIIILVIVSTLMFYVERDAQPEAFGSIPKAICGVLSLYLL